MEIDGLDWGQRENEDYAHSSSPIQDRHLMHSMVTTRNKAQSVDKYDMLCSRFRAHTTSSGIRSYQWQQQQQEVPPPWWDCSDNCTSQSIWSSRNSSSFQRVCLLCLSTLLVCMIHSRRRELEMGFQRDGWYVKKPHCAHRQFWPAASDRKLSHPVGKCDDD